MNENEKRILTVLAGRGPSTRKEIAAACGISWAATVKLVGRLEEQGILSCLGEGENRTDNGKTSLVYDLAETGPLAVGIDVEYSHTVVTAQNLRHRIFYSETAQTPVAPDLERFVSFLAGLVERCRADLEARGLRAQGIGVGMPGWLVPSEKPVFSSVAGALSAATGLPVEADNNTRAYTLYMQKILGAGGSFASFVVRNGVGLGIALDGRLYRGETGLAGELGHLTVDPEGPLCRCGKRGCVEAFFNQRILARRGAELAGVPFEGCREEAEEREYAARLFSESAAGNEAALAALREELRYFAPALAVLILGHDIGTIIVNGHFGDAGSVMLPLLREELRRELYPRFEYRLEYRPITDEGFAVGAAMLFLSRFSDYTVFD